MNRSHYGVESPFRHIAAWGLVLLAMLPFPAIVQAGSGAVWSLPYVTPKKPNTTGWTVVLDTSWVDGCGYRPVRVTVAPVAPLPADHTVHVRFEPSLGGGRGASVAVAQDIEVPAGTTSVTATLAVPQMEPWNTFNFDVVIDGRYYPELSVPAQMAWAGNQTWGDDSSPNFLMLSAVTSSLALEAALGKSSASFVMVGMPAPVSMAGPAGPGIAPAPAIVPAGATGIGGIKTLGDLPERWIDYSSLDVVCGKLSEFQTLALQHPKQWQAIRQWAISGGNLMVYDLGDKWESLAALERMVDFPTSAEGGNAGDLAARGWEKPLNRLSGRALEGMGRNYSGYSATTVNGQVIYSGTPQPMAQQQQPPQGSKPKASPAVPFLLRPFGLGMIIALPDDDPFADNSRDWTWVFNSLGPDHWQWYRRHGLSMQRENIDFWDFLIPDVGLAPVTQFQVLITLFVVGIGPLNYYLLRRWQKLNLLIFTVPASAALITGCLFVYALLADGLGVRVRTRSVTQIDQRRGDAVCWTRLSYYAGLSPSRGMTFPGDAIVLPLEDSADGGNYNSRRRHRRLDWDAVEGGQEQNLTAGWLAARTPTQLLTVRARTTASKLSITETPPSPPKVENQLGANILELILVDSSGACFGLGAATASVPATAGETPSAQVRLKAGEAATLVPLDPAKASSQIHAIYSKQPLSRPPGMDPNYNGQVFGFSRRYNYWAQRAAEMQAPSQHTSILEHTLTSLAENARESTTAQTAPVDMEDGVEPKNPGPKAPDTASPGAPGAIRPAPLRPRTYIAIVDRSGEVAYGVKSFDEEASLHVIVGRW